MQLFPSSISIAASAVKFDSSVNGVSYAHASFNEKFMLSNAYESELIDVCSRGASEREMTHVRRFTSSEGTIMESGGIFLLPTDRSEPRGKREKTWSPTVITM